MEDHFPGRTVSVSSASLSKLGRFGFGRGIVSRLESERFLAVQLTGQILSLILF